MSGETTTTQATETTEQTPEQVKLASMGLGKAETTEKPVENKEEEATKPEPETETETKPKAETETELKPQEEISIDWEKVTSGRFKTQDEFNAFISEHEKIKSEFEPLKQKHTTLEQEYGKIKNQPYMDSPELYKVFKIAQELNISDYGVLFNIVQSDFSKVSDFEALKHKELLENADIYKGKEHLLDKGLLDRYNINKPNDYDDLDEAEQKQVDDRIAINEVKMAKEAKAARKYLTELQNKYTPQTVNNEEVEKQKMEKLTSIVSTWKPTYDSMEKDFKSITFDYEGSSITVPIRTEDAKLKEQVFQEAANYIVMNGLELNDKNINDLRGLIEDRYVSLNKKYVFAKIAEMSAIAEREKNVKQIHNPKEITETVKAEKTEATPEQLAIQKLQKT